MVASKKSRKRHEAIMMTNVISVYISNCKAFEVTGRSGKSLAFTTNLVQINNF